jgi:response regulator RpfG family c-di-GMP phosphodiesterase
MNGKPRLLLVDDDEKIVASFARLFRNQFDLATATTGEAALEIVKTQGPFAVAVSDYNMPGMNGIAFLSKMREISPDTARILLTGHAHVEMAIAAVNKGSIFSFLRKPCPFELIFATIMDAVAHHRLLASEKELLDKTLKGSITMLVDVLSHLSPTIFGVSASIHKLAGKIARQLKLEKVWDIELAALLSQIGLVTLPAELVGRKMKGGSLNEIETKLYFSHAIHGSSLVANIPRLENVSNAIRYQFKNFDGTGLPVDDASEKNIPIGARILKAILDFDEMTRNGKTPLESFEIMKSRDGAYDAEILAALRTEVWPEEL